MSVLNSCDGFEIDRFLGPDLLSDEADVQAPWIRSAKNVVYRSGSGNAGAVETRPGFHSQNVLQGGPAYRHLHALNVLGSTWLVYFSAGGTYLSSYSVPATFLGFGSITNQLGVLAVTHGYMIYILEFTSLDTGQFIAVNVLVPSPATYTFQSAPPRVAGAPSYRNSIQVATSLVAVAGGSVTPGTHKVGLLIQTKSGYITRPGPSLAPSLGTTDPTDFGQTITVSATGQKIQVSYTPSGGDIWPADWDKAYLLMTTASNNSRYLRVPVEPVSIPVTTSTAISWEITISDLILSQQLDVTKYEYQGYFTSEVYGLFNCNARTAYLGKAGKFGVGYGVVFSEINNMESFSWDRSLVHLPNLRRPCCVAAHQSTYYVFGENSTYAFTDTGGYPVTWPTPREVDGRIGTSKPLGVSINRSGLGFVAHSSGLYRFEAGNYNTIPVSYNQDPLWRTINWSNENFAVIDDRTNFRVHVLCQDSAGARRHWVWDYTNGLDPATIKFSEWTFAAADSFSGVIMRNPGDIFDPLPREQLVLGTGDTNGLYLQRGPGDLPAWGSLYQDAAGYKIDSEITTGIMPPKQHDYLLIHRGLRLRVYGQGAMTVTAQSLDGALSTDLANIQLEGSPGKLHTRLFDLRHEGLKYRLRTSGNVGDWFRLSWMKHYYRPWVQQREALT